MTSASRPYEIDFALIVLTGNLTRYQIVRPFVERDETVQSNWFPIQTWFAEDPLRFLPGEVRIRLRHLVDSWGLFAKRPPDAAVIHALETYPLYCAFNKLLRRQVLIVNNHDAHPKPGWPTSFAVKNTDLFILWSEWGAGELRRHYPAVPEEKIRVIHPGIPLADWPLREPRPKAAGPFRLLFVGADYPRKGGDTLLTAFAQHLFRDCELDIVTQAGYLTQDERARIEGTPNVRLHLGLTPRSPELKRLYRECDCFVMPTTWDCSPWVVIESLASGVPIVTTDVGGIPDMVQDGRTGLLVKPGDTGGIAAAVTRLRTSPDLTERFAREGRAHVEANYDAEKNTRRFLDTLKELIDARRQSGRGTRKSGAYQPVSQGVTSGG
jgi:glycosyltransferase involved in cell wall biosynthesis